MKSLARSVFINALSLYFLTLIFSGVKVSGGITSYIIGGIVLTIMFNVLKPVINILSLPLNIITLGTFSFIINILIFYIATQILGNITITGFVYSGFTYAGFVIPKVSLNTFFAYVTVSLVQSLFVSFISWLRK